MERIGLIISPFRGLLRVCPYTIRSKFHRRDTAATPLSFRNSSPGRRAGRGGQPVKSIHCGGGKHLHAFGSGGQILSDILSGVTGDRALRSDPVVNKGRILSRSRFTTGGNSSGGDVEFNFVVLKGWYQNESVFKPGYREQPSATDAVLNGCMEALKTIVSGTSFPASRHVSRV
jgi:hypothetical protein